MFTFTFLYIKTEKKMLQRFYFLLKYILFWLSFLIISRIIFLVYNLPLSSKVPFADLLMCFAKGIRLDLSVMGYVSFFASLILAATFLTKKNIIKKILNIYTLIFLIFFNIITVVDIELYRNWGFRMDSTVFLYLAHPKEALASTAIWLTFVLLLLTALLIIASYYTYKKLISKNIDKFSGINWFTPLLFVFLAGVLFIPIRGGVGIAPINTGAVYFSNNTFSNHAAINVHWQFGESLGEMNKKRNIEFMPQNDAKQVFDSLYTSKSAYKPICKNTKPNIIILILESFSSRMIEPLGGMANVTPNINKLVKEGVLFNHFFANGDRSDKGIVSVLSGYPAQPKTSIIKNSVKTEKLPFLANKLNKIGYNSSFYYGGDINFANMRQYLVNSQFNKLVYLKDFDPKYQNSKWGIHDHIVFNRFYNDCNNEQKPFFKVFFTLSSHEPFDVPHKSIFDKNTEEQKFLNSAHYTDSCVGNFVDKAKQQQWWKNTLMFIVADHSGRHPDNVSYNSRIKFEIPLLILGGALKNTDTIVQSYCNQTDIPKIIGRVLNKNFDEFYFSKNEISDNQSFAFFAFNNGFGYFTDSSGFVFDNSANKIIDKQGKFNANIEKQGKAFMQVLITDYNNK